MAKKRIKRNKRYFNTYDGGGLLGQFASWNEGATKNFMSSGVGGALGKLGVSSGGLGGLANGVASTVSGLINPSGNSTGVGNAMQAIGSVASNIPGIGGVIGAGVNLVGGLVNTMFGSNLNEEFINQTETSTENQNNWYSKASDTSSFLSDFNSYRDMDYVSQDDVGSDGWFSNKAKNKTKELNAEIDKANRRAQLSLGNTLGNIMNTQASNALRNIFDYGGSLGIGAIGYELASRDLNNKQMKALGDMKLTSLPNSFNALPDVGTINTFAKGGGIHIKKKNRGKFTDYCGGKVTSECIARGKRSSSPTIRKRATFAQNARKFKHAYGGFLEDGGELNARKWKHEDGGPLFTHGGIWNNGLTYINEGGSHEENPFEGVQMGVDPQGIPNLVEEGEVVYNDYVFSNRMKVPKDVKKRLKTKGDTFAEAAKELSKESEERPNDPISKNGLNAFMSALSESQEELRMKNENRRANRYAKGGKLGNLFDGTGDRANRLNPYSNFTPLTNDDFYTPEYMNFWNWYNNNQDTPEGRAWLNRINSGEFGSIGGNTFTPADIVRLSHDYKKGPVHNAFALAAAQYNKENPKAPPYTPYTRRWIREKGADGVWRTQQISDEDWNATPAGRTYLMRNPNLKEGNTVTSDRGDKDIYYDVIPEELPEELIGDVTEVKGIRQSPLRYAPLIGSGLAVLNDMFGGNAPDYSNADLFAGAIRSANRPIGTRPIGEYLAYRPLDRMFYINQLNKNSASSRRAIQNTAGGNRATALAGILAADSSYGESLGKLARQAEEYNQALRERVKDFNRQTNMFNSEQGTKVDMFNTELLGRQASLYGQLANMRQRILEGNRAEKSANLTNFIQGLGDLGREITDRDTLRWLADIGALPYNTRGQYTGGNTTAAPKKSKRGKIKRRKGFTV